MNRDTTNTARDRASRREKIADAIERAELATIDAGPTANPQCFDECATVVQRSLRIAWDDREHMNAQLRARFRSAHAFAERTFGAYIALPEIPA